MEEKLFEFELKDDVYDTITKYSGIVTARIEYVGGHKQYLVESTTDTSRKERFDEPRLELLN